MKTILLLTLGSLSCAALVGCGDDTVAPAAKDASIDHVITFDGATIIDTGTGADADAGTSGEGGAHEGGAEGGGPTVPLAPVLGTQIDRMGRPAVNTALNHTFDPSCTAAACPAKDAYNADDVITHWSSYVPEFELNLAIYDGLDGNCGNQAGFTAASGYATLAGVLADDRLWVNTVATTCQQYLAVEFNALGVTNADCGGRTPNENAIDLTFNLVAGTLKVAGLPSNPGSLTNGITVPSAPAATTFPYLQPPH
ncbi:MAG TPA: DUF4331 family protein [Polyangiaceae bacterium]